MIKFSIIVPVYNVERYLRRCLDSCLIQDLSLDSYEIVVVNDGSPDNSLTIIREYEQKYSNIVVIDKTNGGLSSARNAGLKNAKGEYVWFVDSDDSIKENCIGVIYNMLKKHNCQCLTFNCRILNEDGAEVQDATRRHLDNNTCYTGVEVFETDFIYPYTGAQYYIFERDYLLNNELWFKEGIFFEDCLFTTTILSRISRFLYIQDKIYNYYLHGNTITHSKSTLKKGVDNIIVASELHKSLDKCSDDKKCIIYKMISIMIKAVYREWCGLTSSDRRKLSSEFFAHDIWSDAIKRSQSYKYYVFILLMKLDVRIKRLGI